MGRPKIDIDPIKVYKLARLGCQVKEIADFFGCTDDTIINRFSEELNKGRSNLKRRLRKWQIQSAKNGNIAMMIWLGKQMLGQMERAQIDITKIDDEAFMLEARRRLEEQKKLESK